MSAVRSFRETLLCGASVPAVIRAERDMHALEEMRVAKRRMIFKDAGIDVAGAILKEHNIEDEGP